MAGRGRPRPGTAPPLRRQHRGDDLGRDRRALRGRGAGPHGRDVLRRRPPLRASCSSRTSSRARARSTRSRSTASGPGRRRTGSFPPSVLRTFREEEQIELVFGSCRVAAPHEPPYTLPKELDEENGRGFDALHALALSILEEESPAYPDLLFLCGDQVYADEVSPTTQEFIDAREDRPRRRSARPGRRLRGVHAPLPGVVVASPVIRWLLSTVSSSMVIDDHDMHDDWNISQAWCEEMEREAWWQERVARRDDLLLGLPVHRQPLARRAARAPALASGCWRTATTRSPVLREYMEQGRPGARGQALELLPRPRHDAADRRRRAHRALPRRGGAQDRRRRRVGLDRRARRPRASSTTC